MSDKVISVVFAGLGGQGVVKASDILSEAAFAAGYDVKKSEGHGMSQRGGSVTSDVRFGPQVFSPMVPLGEADFLVVLESSEVDVTKPRLAPDGLLLSDTSLFEEEEADELREERTLNVAMLGALSCHLPIPHENWLEAIRANLPAKVLEHNIEVFTKKRAVEMVMRGITDASETR